MSTVARRDPAVEPITLFRAPDRGQGGVVAGESVSRRYAEGVVAGEREPGHLRRNRDGSASRKNRPRPERISEAARTVASRDFQVTVEDFDGWREALAGSRKTTFKLSPGLNHLFEAGTGPSTFAEYQDPAHVSEAVIADIASWLGRRD